MENKYKDYSSLKAMKEIVNDNLFRLKANDIEELTKIICGDNGVLRQFLNHDCLSALSTNKIISIIENIPDDKIYLLLKSLSNHKTGYGDIVYKLLKKYIYKIKKEKRELVESAIMLIELEKNV